MHVVTSVIYIIITQLGLYAMFQSSSYILQELSGVVHDSDGDHNSIYDHEAFLGREEAEEFDGLSPEESKERLGLVDQCMIVSYFLYDKL